MECVQELARRAGISVRAEPSAYVDDETAALHRGRGVIVRDVPGAAHSVWYSHFDEFVAALPEVFQEVIGHGDGSVESWDESTSPCRSSPVEKNASRYSSGARSESRMSEKTSAPSPRSSATAYA